MPMGGLELLILLVIILLFFGARRVPELARSLGRAKHEMHKGIEESEAEEEERKKAEAEEEERKKAEARQDTEESSAPEGAHTEDGNVPEGEKPKAGPGANA
jgi:sec-independent protein translocase protein TatA